MTTTTETIEHVDPVTGKPAVFHSTAYADAKLRNFLHAQHEPPKPAKQSKAQAGLRRFLGSSSTDDAAALRPQAKAVQESLDKWSPKYAPIKSFVRELSSVLVDTAEAVEIEQNQNPALAAVFESIKGDAEWFKLLDACSSSRLATSIAMQQLTASAVEQLGLEKLDENAEKGDANELESEAKAREIVGEIGGLSDEEKQAIEDLRNRAQAARERDSAIAGSAGLSGAVKAAREAIGAAAAAADAAANAEKALRGAGYSPTGEDSAEQIVGGLMSELTENRMIGEVIRLCGKMLDAIKGAEALDEMAKSNVRGVKLGNDIGTTTPSFRARMFGGGAVGMHAMGQLSESAAQVWDTADKLPAMGGDVIVLVDRSGSMGGAPGIWARGLGFAAVIKAAADNRRIWAGAFDHRCVGTVVPKKDAGKLKDALKMVCLSPSGGTDVEGAITHALDDVEKNGKLKEPDILLISDGEFPTLSKALQDRLRAAEVRVFFVFIDPYGRENQGPTHPEFDFEIHVNEKTLNETSSAEVLRAMQQRRTK